MEWHINDLSLDRQFANPQAFRAALEPLLQLRHRDPSLRTRLYCSRLLHARQVTATSNLQQAVIGTRDKNFIGSVLEWMGKSGPFWDDDRQPIEDDYFHYQTHDVTNQGLGEAARRRLAGIVANAFSYKGSPLQFTTSPLSVQQGLPEEPIATVFTDNHWEIAQIEAELDACRTYCGWHDVLIEIRRRFIGLIISNTALDDLLPTPFSEQVTKRIFELLDVLDNLVMESDECGELSPTGRELLTKHFVGGKAWFSDESTRNKETFKKQMTFSDPDDPSKEIVCTWHGKIKTPQIRIHFLWPRPTGQNKIKIAYIGPKITKE